MVSREQLRIIGAGKSAVIYQLDDKTALKLFNPRTKIEIVENEIHALQLASVQGLPVPNILATQLSEEKSVTLTYLAGHNLYQEFAARPWRLITLLTQAAKLQHLIHQKDGTGLPRGKPELERNVLNAKFPTILRDAIQKAIRELPENRPSLCHGDYHFSNLLFGGDTLYALDWAKAKQEDPAFDVAQTLTQILYGGPSNFAFKSLEKFGRSLIAKKFLQAYLKCLAKNQRHDFAWRVNKWLPICTAAKYNFATHELQKSIQEKLNTYFLPGGT